MQVFHSVSAHGWLDGQVVRRLSRKQKILGSIPSRAYFGTTVDSLSGCIHSDNTKEKEYDRWNNKICRSFIQCLPLAGSVAKW